MCQWARRSRFRISAKHLSATTANESTAGIVGRIPLPHLMLKAKLANSALIQQDARQDVKHARMMLLCVRAFMVEMLENCGRGLVGERAVVNVLEEIREVISSPNAEKAGKLWGFDFSAIWPMVELEKEGDGKIARWMEHRFP